MNERAKLYEIKMKLLSGIISYDEAMRESEPFIKQLNEKGKLIAKKHNRRFVETTFSAQMR